MHKKKWLGTTIQITAILSLIVFATGFILGITNVLSPPTSNTLSKQEKASSSLASENGLLVGLGDSLTRGIGDEKGLGYIGLVRNQLQEASLNTSIQLSNLAISGQTSSELLEQLQQKQVQQLIQQSQWITVTIGGNDLKDSIEDLETIDLKQAEKNRKIFEKNLEQILKTIRSYNQKTPVFLFSLYNPYGDLSERELTSKTVLQWNETIQDISQKYTNIIVVPTFDLFQIQPTKYLSSDHFHPNHQGYQRMAERLMQIIKDTPTRRTNK